jgi:hypothetical protein
LVHYPMFQFLDLTTYSNAMQFHQQRISLIVVPLMLFELLSGAYLAHSQWAALSGFHTINIACLLIIWGHTFGLMVPFHQTMATQPNIALLQKTLQHHWIRTLAWSLKSVLWGAILWHILSI